MDIKQKAPHGSDLCSAELHIADDFGDNHATMRCQLRPGHEGLHREEYERNGGIVSITWACDDREESASPQR